MKTVKNSFLILLFAGLFFQSCNRTDVYALQIKSIDSLSGAINVLVKQTHNDDTVILSKAILRFKQYKQFIELNVKDTVNKLEADFIQQFYLSGKNLENFELNRKSILARTALINSQIEKLKKDIKNKSVPEEKLIEFTSLEKKEAANLIEINYSQQQLFYSSLQEFKTSLKGVEELIKIRNAGQLPTIIKDTLSL